MELVSESCFCNEENSPLANSQEVDKSWMIECDVCHVWFHGGCVNLTNNVANSIDKYHCARCEPMCGPSLYRASTNAHRHDVTDPNASNKATQIGTQVFVEELKRRHFSPGLRVVKAVEGIDLTLDFLTETKFESPLIIRRPDSLDLNIPKLSLETVKQVIGGEKIVDVIDVQRQETLSMTLEDFVYNFQHGDRVLNCLSLEVTDSDLDVDSPGVVREMCWVRTMWPNNKSYEHTEAPKVSKYCIMSMAKSYTDFHIDFGGTSVWYHIATGSKVFYLIPPTNKNLGIFERWHRLSRQSETFFADMVGECHKMEVNEGETILLPTGWIHAVYTPEDSIVLGGNFLHSLNIPLQLRIRDLEEKMRIPSKYKFPNYEAVNWYAAPKLLKKSKSILASSPTGLPTYLHQGLKAMQKALKNWSEDSIPPEVNSHRILRELGKILKQSDKRNFETAKTKKKDLATTNLKIKLNQEKRVEDQVEVQDEEDLKPIKLMIPNPFFNHTEDQQNLNLTDRESVRTLMLARKKKNMADLNQELSSALLSFGNEESEPSADGGTRQEEESDLKIDFTLPVKKRVKNFEPATKKKPNYFIPKMTEVHQDDQFVYPSLDFSDDDDIDEGKLTKDDSNWNPKARVKAGTTQKRERLPRDKAKRIEVEKGLQLASKRLKEKKSLKRKLAKLNKSENTTSKTNFAVAGRTLLPQTSSGSLSHGLSQNPILSATSSNSSKITATNNVMKPKKGLATAKQRLGKKLKLKFC